MVALQRLVPTMRVTLLLGASMLLAACAGAAPTTSPAPTEAPKTEASPAAKDEGKPKYGGIMTEAESLSVDQVNPDAHLSRGSPAISVHGNIHGYILAEDMQNRGTITGDLATSWQSSPDGLTWTFTIRDGLQTHKGKPFSAEDVAYNINRMIERPNNLNLFRTGCMRELAKEAKAPDKTTVVVTLRDRSPVFLSCASDPHMYMQPKYILEEIDGPGKGRPMRPEEIDGVGPFQFAGTAESNFWDLKRSDSFFKQGLPYLDGLRFVELPDAASKIAAFRTQRIDMFQKYAVVPRPSEAKALKAEFGDKITLQPGVAPGGPSFQLNWKRPPLDDIRVREAINLAYDRQAENELLKEGAATWSGPYYCGWGTIFTCEELLTWPGHRPDKTQDLQRARQLLSEAGYGADNPLTLTALCTGTGGADDNCTLLVESLKKVNIQLKINRLETSTHVATARKGEFDITTAGRITPADDPEIFHGTFYLPDAPVNYARWENPRFMELFEQERREMNPEKRYAMLKEMAKIIYNDHVSLHSYNEVLIPGFWNYVKGYTPPVPKKPHQTTYRHDTTWIDVDSPLRMR